MACAAFISIPRNLCQLRYSPISDKVFDMQSSDVGLMMTVYAWTVMIMSLPAMLATGDMERKGLLLKLLSFLSSAILSRSFAWNYWILLIARMCIAVAHSLFWAISIISDACCAKNKKTQAIGMLAISYIPCDYFGLTIRPFNRSISWLAYYFRNHCRISFGCDGIYYAFITKSTK